MISFIAEIRSSLFAHFPNEKSEELHENITRGNKPCHPHVEVEWIIFFGIAAFPKNLWT